MTLAWAWASLERMRRDNMSFVGNDRQVRSTSPRGRTGRHACRLTRLWKYQRMILMAQGPEVNLEKL